jgi:cytoskeleton protein RodZ
MTANDPAIRVVSDSGSDVGPGQRLREAREAAQLTVAEVASRLRLGPRVLDRLENDDYEQLHGPTFVRGYLSSYARLLDLPERPILEAYERHGYGPPALVSELVRKPEVHISDFPVRMVTYVIAGLLVILVVLWWQSRQPKPGTLERADTAAESVQQTSGPSATGGSSAETESPPASPASPPLEGDTASGAPSVETFEPAVAEAASEATGESDARQPQVAMLDEQSTGSEAVHIDAPPSEDTLDGESHPQAQTSTQSAGTSTAIAAEPVGEATSPTERDVAATEATSSADGTATTTAAGAEEQVAPAPRPTPLPGSDVLAIQLATESWVEIYDRGGGRLYYSLAREGSEVIVRGAGPLQVLLGDVEGAAVAYNGEPFDLSRYQGRSVVRFTVGEPSSTTTPEPPAPAGDGGAPYPGDTGAGGRRD